MPERKETSTDAHQRDKKLKEGKQTRWKKIVLWDNEKFILRDLCGEIENC